MTLPQYPTLLGWAPREELERLGLRENGSGQLQDSSGRLVCEISGRSHDGGPDREPYLIGPLPMFDPASMTWRAIWIDKDTAKEAGFSAARRGGYEIGRFLLSLASRTFRAVIR